MLTSSGKRYLFAIYRLGREGKGVRSTDVARLMGVSCPSTVKALQNLADEGYIIKAPYAEITLTDKGIIEANRIYTASVVIEKFLSSKVGVEIETAELDTNTIVADISCDTLDKLVNYIISVGV